MSRKKIITLLAVVAGLAFAIAIVMRLVTQGVIGDPNRALFNRIKDKPQLVELYRMAEDEDEKMRAEPENPSRYLNAGLAWKGLGDGSRERVFLEKSLAIYEDGMERFGQKNILFYLNAGKVAESLGDYAKAEQYYRTAITISPLDESSYLYIADMYIYKMKKTNEEILAVFNDAEQKVSDKLAVIWARGTYLRRINDYEKALKDYEALVENFPQEAGYKQIVAELKAKISAGKK